jgi:Transposase, Mutator family
VVNVRENQRVINKALYLVLAVNLNGEKELLGMWIAQSEGARVLALCADGIAEPRSERYLHCVRNWVDRLT